MNASSLLVPPPAKGSAEQRSEKQVQFWKVTFDRIHKFLPGIEGELFPPQAPIVEVKADEKKSAESDKGKDVVEKVEEGTDENV